MSDQVISALVSAIISGVFVAWVKVSMEANAKTRDENLSLKFQSVYNKIGAVDNKVGEVKNEVLAVNGQMNSHQKQTHEIDKKLGVVIAKQEYFEKRIDSILSEKTHDENFGKVLRRD